MKKIITVLFTMILASSLFAVTKVGLAPAYINESYNIDGETHFGYRDMLAGEADIEYYNLWFKDKAEVEVAKNYVDIKNKMNINIWQPAFLTFGVESNSEFVWTNQYAGQSMICYADIGLSAKYYNIISSWLLLGADGYLGYVPVAMTMLPYATVNDGNSLSTKITLWAMLWNHVKVYAGMESIEKFGLPTMEPISLRNTIGAYAFYNIKKVKVYGSVDYYCQHPEKSWKGENTSRVNRARLDCKVGLVYAF